MSTKGGAGVAAVPCKSLKSLGVRRFREGAPVHCEVLMPLKFSTCGGCPLYCVKGGVDAAPLTLEGLAARLGRLSPSHRDPEYFHIEKSEIVAELRRMAEGMRHG